MILSVVVILIVGLIAYMHFLGGLLTGLISMVLALIASAMAMSYYEPLAEMLSGGKFSDISQGVCMLAIFALVYLLGRFLFDKFVPGNVRVPFIADKIGAVVMGLFAGMIAMGMVAIALQTMPFGPSIAGYARYPISDPEKAVSFMPIVGRQGVDRTMYDVTKNADLEKDSQGLLIPVDDFVLGFTKRLSSTGALSTGKPFVSVHPDLLQELYGQRLGIETGAKHTAVNDTKGTQVTAQQINVLPQSIPRAVGEFSEIWETPKGNLAPEPGKRLISITIMFNADSSDEGSITRVSPGSIRLVVPPPNTEDSSGEYTNCFPIGTVQGGKVWGNRIDDYLFFDLKEESRGAHFIFQVDETALETKIPGKQPAAGKPAIEAVYAMREGTFVEVKRLAKIPLQNTKIVLGMPVDEKKYRPLRKVKFFDDKTQTALTGTPTPTTPTPTTPTPTTPTPTTPTPTTPTPGDNGWAEATLENPSIAESIDLPQGIGVPKNSEGDVLTAAASGHLVGRKFDTLEVDPSNDAADVVKIASLGNWITELSAPAGKRMVQVTLTVKVGSDPWAWAPNLANYTVVDGAGMAYKPSGVMSMATAGRSTRLLAIYKSTGEVSVKKANGVTVNTVIFVYLLPTGQKATEIRYNGKAGGPPLEK